MIHEHGCPLKDLEWTENLVQYMREHNMFDTEEGQAQRLLILGKLYELMKKWIVKISIEKVRINVTAGYRSKHC